MSPSDLMAVELRRKQEEIERLRTLVDSLGHAEQTGDDWHFVISRWGIYIAVDEDLAEAANRSRGYRDDRLEASTRQDRCPTAADQSPNGA